MMMIFILEVYAETGRARKGPFVLMPNPSPIIIVIIIITIIRAHETVIVRYICSRAFHRYSLFLFLHLFRRRIIGGRMRGIINVVVILLREKLFLGRGGTIDGGGALMNEAQSGRQGGAIIGV